MAELERSWGKVKAQITEQMSQKKCGVDDAVAASGSAADGETQPGDSKPSAASSSAAAAAKPYAAISSSSLKPSNLPAIDLRVPIKTKSEDSSTRPKKKGKAEQYFLEIKWDEYISAAQRNMVDDDSVVNHSVFADEIRGKFSDSSIFMKKYEGENHEHNLTFCLVDSKSEHRKELVEIHVYYWDLPINLMHFHILSQDLANFSRKLWVAAGKNEDVYCDMSIEFGSSNIGKWEVKKLVSKAMGIKRKSDVLYVKDVKMHTGSTLDDSLKLLEMIFKTCKSTIVIAYKVDLTKLGVVGNYGAIGLTKMSNYDCYIGPNRKF